MLLATILLMCPVPQTGDVAKSVVDVPAVVSTEADTSSTPSVDLPSAPVPQTSLNAADPASSTPSVQPGSPAFQPLKPVYIRPRETPRQRKMWYALMATSHGAAAFDAWSTRRAVSQGFVESNPFLRPAAGSNAIYAATQISPLVMDFIGKRMMTSEHLWIRRTWWLPQTIGSAVSFTAAVHNVGVMH